MTSIDPFSWDEQLQKLDASFLQSSMWATFQEAMGATVHYLSGADWSCLLIEQESRWRRYLFAPYGPTLQTSKALPAALTTIVDFARGHQFHWVRLEPSLGLSVDTNLDDALTQIKVPHTKAHKQVDPLFTRILDLTPSEDDILRSISSRTRSLIRKHLNQPVLEFRTSHDSADMSLFLSMMHTVSRRNQVFFHSDEHFLKEAEVLMPKGEMRLEFALLDNKPIACIVMHDFNDVTNYTYAASLPEARDVNASAFLLWQAIRNAKAAGMTRLDLFGVIPDDSNPSHPWAGFTAFKRKFGGTVVRRGETIDIPLSPRYHAYRAALKVRK